MAIPDNPHIFRMVHWQNVEHILRHGICSREHTDYDPNYVDIGHRQLIEDRHQYPVSLGNDFGHLGEYVPFYFAGHTPMLYLIMNGYKGVTKRPQEDIVYIVSRVNYIAESNLEYVFTDRNAKIAFAEFYSDLKDLDKLKWDIIKNQIWKNSEDNLARQDFKQAEFLVRHHVPVELIKGLVVYNEERERQMKKLISDFKLDIKIYIDNNRTLYY